MAILNFNSGKNYIIPSEDNTTYRGLAGDDIYIISQATGANAKIDIIDTEGANIIQLVDGITISASLFTSNATRLTLSNGAEITISGADKFTYETSGNSTTGDIGANRVYSDFAKGMGLVEGPPTSGSQNGTANISITDSFGWVGTKYFGSDGNDDITLDKDETNDVKTGKGNDIIRDVLATDIVEAGAGADTVYISYTTLDPDTSASIDGGSETSDFDWIVSDLAADTEKDFTLWRTAFANFEGYDFTDSETQTIVLDSDDFVTINNQTLKIAGDASDKVEVPEGASQTRTEGSYNYYSLNDTEIGIADDLTVTTASSSSSTDTSSSSSYTVVNISVSADETITATSSAEDFRYEIDSEGVSKEGAFKVTIDGFDKAADKLTLVIVGETSNLTTQEFDALNDVDVTSDGISGTQIFFAPDTSLDSGQLVLPNVEEAISGAWDPTTYTVEIIAEANLI